jgi:WD40 repeat protein
MNWRSAAVGLAMTALIGCGRGGPELSGRLFLVIDGDLLAIRNNSTETIAKGVRTAALSPDRRYIASSASSGLSVLDLTNGTRRMLTSLVPVQISWSPDSSRLAFISSCMDGDKAGNTVFVSDLSSAPQSVYVGTGDRYAWGYGATNTHYVCGLLDSHWVTNEHLIIRAQTWMPAALGRIPVPPEDRRNYSTFVVTLGTQPEITKSDQDWVIWRVCSASGALLMNEPSGDKWFAGRFDARSRKIEAKGELPTRQLGLMDAYTRALNPSRYFPAEFYESDCSSLVALSRAAYDGKPTLAVLDAGSFLERSRIELGQVDLAGPLLVLPERKWVVSVFSHIPGFFSHTRYDVTVFDIATGERRVIWRRPWSTGDQAPTLLGWTQ